MVVIIDVDWDVFLYFLFTRNNKIQLKQTDSRRSELNCCFCVWVCARIYHWIAKHRKSTERRIVYLDLSYVTLRTSSHNCCAPSFLKLKSILRFGTSNLTVFFSCVQIQFDLTENDSINLLDGTLPLRITYDLIEILLVTTHCNLFAQKCTKWIMLFTAIK